MRKFAMLLLLISFVSCKNGNKRKMKILNQNNLTIKGYTIRDSIFDDTVFYYKNNLLIQKSVFKEGKIDGTSTNYSLTGKPIKITNYSNGLLNGYNSYFDSAGKCFYKDFYYYNLIVGPIIYRNEDESPKRFFFVNLQNETLLDIDYKKWNGIEKIVPSCINYIYTQQKSDTTSEGSLLLYLINPPKLNFTYSLLKINKNNKNDFSKAEEINMSFPFQNFVLPVLSDSFYYSIRLEVYDSILNKKTLINKEVFPNAN